MDRFFCRDGIGVERVGGDSPWWVIASRLGPGTNVLSGGAGKDISFELELVRKHGCRVAIFDPSPTGIRTFELSGSSHEGLFFFPFGLDAHCRRVAFAAPREQAEGSYSLLGGRQAAMVEFDCLSPEAAVARVGFKGVELVKIDIEGFEYGFLEAMLSAGIRPPQLAVEFHHFLPHIPFSRTWRAIRRLHAAGYRIAHKEQCDFLFVHRTAQKP